MTPAQVRSRFWGVRQGDSEAGIAAAERRLGVLLPPMLREQYATTRLRSSQQLHLAELDDIEVRNEHLIFGSEQQGVFEWGIRCDALAEPDPWLQTNAAGWEHDGIRLSQWLVLFMLFNRVYEPPCAHEWGPSEEQLDGWARIELSSSSFGTLSVYCKGDVVADEYASMGARTEAGLRAALAELELTPDEADLDLGPRAEE